MRRLFRAGLCTAAVGCGAPSPTVAPTPGPPDLPPIALGASAAPACDPQPYKVRVEGVVRTLSGEPNPGVPIVLGDPAATAADPTTRSGPDGTFVIADADPGLLRIPAWRSSPPHRCVGVPQGFTMNHPEGSPFQMRFVDLSFSTVRMCEVPVVVSGGGDGPADVWVRTPRGQALAGRVEGGSGSVWAPCDLEALSVLDPAHVSTATACGPGWACRDGDGPTVITASQPELAHLTLRAPDGSSVEGLVVRDGLGGAHVADASGAVVVPLTPAGRPRVDAAGWLPQPLDVRPGTATISLRHARQVAVGCAGAPGDRCPVPPTCRAADTSPSDAWPCTLVEGQAAACACPLSSAVVSLADHAVAVPSDAAHAWLDWRASGSAITARATTPGACLTTATRAPHWLTGADGRIDVAVASCSDDGQVTLAPLAPGTWTLRTPGGSTRTVEVGDTVVALGAL